MLNRAMAMASTGFLAALAASLAIEAAESPAPGPPRSTARIYEPGKAERPAGPIALGEGPHLFIDDLLVEASEGVARRVERPLRDPAIPNPVVTGPEDGCFQPYLTVLRDAGTGRFRIWYGHRTEDRNSGASHLGYLESEDGIHWRRPARVLRDPAPIQFGVSIIDEGPGFPDPARRYKYGWWKDGGLKVASSPDGLEWTPMSADVVLRHDHDINSIFRDALRDRYVATVSVYEEGTAWKGRRRVTMQSASADLLRWERPHYVLTPDDRVDGGETQFYAMDGFLARGGLLIGMVKVLRDDLKADDPPDPPDAYGVGTTTLAWTRDGETWTRDREPFFDRDPRKGAWDHAHAWIDEQVPAGDEVFLYYGGYARGHKVARFEERQIGLVKMRRDRYVAREAGPSRGLLRTPPVTLDAGSLTLNASVRGELRVRIVGTDGKPVPGFDWEDAEPIRGDSLAHPVRWKGTRPGPAGAAGPAKVTGLAGLAGRPVRLEFSLRDASIYALELGP